MHMTDGNRTELLELAIDELETHDPDGARQSIVNLAEFHRRPNQNYVRPNEWKRRLETVAERSADLRKALDDVFYFDHKSKNSASSLESKLDDLSEVREFLQYLEEDHRSQVIVVRKEKGRPIQLMEREIVSFCMILFETYSDLRPSTTENRPLSNSSLTYSNM